MNICQLVVFVRGLTPTFDIMEEFVQLSRMKGINTGADIFESVIKLVTEMNLDSAKLIGVITVGAPVMIREKKMFVALLQDIGISHKLHCIIHQDALCAVIEF